MIKWRIGRSIEVVFFTSMAFLALQWLVGYPTTVQGAVAHLPVASEKPLIPEAALPQVIATLQFTPGIGIEPSDIGVNPNTGLIYVANSGSNNVSILSGTQVVTNVGVGKSPYEVGVNPTTGDVYVTIPV